MQKQTQHLMRLIFALLAAALLAACGAPAAGESQPEPPGPPTPDSPALQPEAEEPADAADPAAGADAEEPPEDAAPPEDIPTLPPGWTSFTSPELRLSLAHPPGWQVIPRQALMQLELRESAGDGWVEIGILDTETRSEWGYDFRVGMPADELIDLILSALREDGDFEASRPLVTVEGRTARISQGTYYITGEQMLLGIISLGDRALIVVGHGSEGGDNPGDWARLAPLYEQIITSLGPQ